jgi:hypothetical protein
VIVKQVLEKDLFTFLNKIPNKTIEKNISTIIIAAIIIAIS